MFAVAHPFYDAINAVYGRPRNVNTPLRSFDSSSLILDLRVSSLSV